MDLGLSNKNIIVTGGTRGIGLAAAKACAAEGANLSICGRTQSSLDAAKAELSAYGTTIHAAICDISDAEQIKAYVNDAIAALGGLDGLVNNPSGFGSSDDEEGWGKGLDVDIMGVVRCTWAAAAELQKNKGAIVNVSSISGMGASSNVPYGAVKAAVIQLTQSHALTMAGDQVRVNCVAPGSIEFSGGVWDTVKKHAPDIYNSTLSGIPFGRMGKPEEIGDVVAFLLSDRAFWMTGQTIAIDGAQNL
ncbi:MAG: SDR family NAD(P)-dependent oxidoreductase [Oceanicoccus sp.]